MDTLRTQVMETQKARSDLMKWKLIIVAALGTTGLGCGFSQATPRYVLLCLVPFVCVYVDALCAHLSLRIRAIGDFLAAEEPGAPDERREHDYERFLRSDTPPFRLETLALHWSTTLLSVLVAGSVLFVPVQTGERVALLASGTIGLSLTAGVWGFHRSRVNAIKKAAERWRKRRQ